MKLEAVVVSINYSDFLRFTLPHNKQFFNRIVVVTDLNDKETADVCEFHNVQVIKTDDFYQDGSTVPNKALGINVGLSQLDRDGWVLHMDADIWLPVMFKHILDRFPMKPEAIYGMDRLMCNSHKDWIKYLYGGGKSMHEAWCYLHIHMFPMGQRMVQYQGQGYLPIGYFQLWNPKASGVHHYPVDIEGYDRTDVLFAFKFKRENRLFIPDMACFHLASEKHWKGQNWRGRKSRKFGYNFKDKSFILVFILMMYHFLITIGGHIKKRCRRNPKPYVSKEITG